MYWVGKKKSPESLEKQRLSMLGKIPWNKGKPHTEEHKRKLKIARRTYNSHRTGKQYGHHWNNGVDNKVCWDCPGDGWVKGRLITKPSPNKGKKFGYHWNNGMVGRCSFECPGEGWVRGKHKKVIK